MISTLSVAEKPEAQDNNGDQPRYKGYFFTLSPHMSPVLRALNFVITGCVMRRITRSEGTIKRDTVPR